MHSKLGTSAVELTEPYGLPSARRSSPIWQADQPRRSALAVAEAAVLDLIGDEDGHLDGLTKGEHSQRRLRKVTGHLVKRHRRSIEALAHALLQEGVITDKRVRSLIGFALPRGSAVARRHSKPR
jgi:hypothetical protein